MSIITPADLRLLRKDQPDGTVIFGNEDGTVAALTPEIDENYWTYCVPLAEGQAIVGIPKFGIIGIGFAVEEDWNSNLPAGCPTDKILLWIWHNRGPVTDSLLVRKAIAMVQEAAFTDGDHQQDLRDDDWEISDYMIPGHPDNGLRF